MFTGNQATCTHVLIYTCAHVRMYTCTRVHMYTCTQVCRGRLIVCMRAGPNSGAHPLAGDNAAAQGIIAREIALDVADSAYSVDTAEHIPGIANKAADALSRISQPGKSSNLPEYLSEVPRAQFEARNRAWWRALPAEP